MSKEAQAKEAFNAFDADGSGCICKREMVNCLKAIFSKIPEFEGKDIDHEAKAVAYDLFKDIDDDGDGKIQWDEFWGELSGKL